MSVKGQIKQLRCVSVIKIKANEVYTFVTEKLAFKHMVEVFQQNSEVLLPTGAIEVINGLVREKLLIETADKLARLLIWRQKTGASAQNEARMHHHGTSFIFIDQKYTAERQKGRLIANTVCIHTLVFITYS